MKEHILTLDVGFANMGWMVLYDNKPVACGVIHTDKDKSKKVAIDYSERSQRLGLGLKDIIETYSVKGITGEMPHGGAQSSAAASMMSMSNAIASVSGAWAGLPMEWTSPSEGKIALSGKRDATKEEQMENCIRLLKGSILHEGKSEYYHIPDCKGAERLRKNMFEHIADSYGAYLALRNSALIKMFT